MQSRKCSYGYCDEGDEATNGRGRITTQYDIKDRPFHRTTHKDNVDEARGAVSKEIEGDILMSKC